LSKKSDAEVIRQVEACIDAAIEKNRHTERIVIGVLVSLFVVGLGLMVYAAIIRRWELLVPGSLLQIILFFPIRKLIQLREDNMRLRILPQLMRLADSDEAKLLAARLVKRLIEKV
jgi:MFS superfamily sulfate permease-like transporter